MHDDVDDLPPVEDETTPPSDGGAASDDGSAARAAAPESSDDAPRPAGDAASDDDGPTAAADDAGAAVGAGDDDDTSLTALAARAEAEGTSMMALLLEEGDFLPGRFQRGDIVEGTVVQKGRDQLTVNLGAKQEAVVPASDIARVPKAIWDAIQEGERLQLVVLRPDGRDGEIVLSLSQALTGEDWDRAEAMLESGEVAELEIVGFNRGGLLAGFGGLQGFIPRSQMARAMPEGGPERMAEFVGQRVVVKIVEVSRPKRRLIMSERQAAREWRSERKRQLLGDLKENEVRRGRVTSVADFGAFVDLGGADGLVHVSEMSYDRNRRPSDLVKVGDEVDVVVLSIDRDRKRISLSMKRLQKDPWQAAADAHYIGELVDGRVVNVADFGAFVRLSDQLEGLVHVSELSDAPVRHPSEVVRIGQTVTVEIIALDPERQRLGLSLRRVPDHLRHADDGPGASEPAEPTAMPDDAAASGSADEGDAAAGAVDAAPAFGDIAGAADDTADAAEPIDAAGADGATGGASDGAAPDDAAGDGAPAQD